MLPVLRDAVGLPGGWLLEVFSLALVQFLGSTDTGFVAESS